MSGGTGWVGPLAPRARWWRLTNPDVVDVEIAHVEDWGVPGDLATLRPRHVVRVSQKDSIRDYRDGVTRRTVVTSETDLVPTRLGEVAQPSVAEFAQGALFVHTVGAPAVGEWVPVSEDDVLTAVAKDGARGAGSWTVGEGQS